MTKRQRESSVNCRARGLHIYITECTHKKPPGFYRHHASDCKRVRGSVPIQKYALSDPGTLAWALRGLVVVELPEDLQDGLHLGPEDAGLGVAGDGEERCPGGVPHYSRRPRDAQDLVL